MLTRRGCWPLTLASSTTCVDLYFPVDVDQERVLASHSGLLNYLFIDLYFPVDVDQERVLASHSGLLNYLFGVNRDKALTKEKLKKLQSGNWRFFQSYLIVKFVYSFLLFQDLLDEVILLEFKEYDKVGTYTLYICVQNVPYQKIRVINQPCHKTI